jgi:beta-phosphoglucomutase-like phosphatase (HAD superfamily)
MAHPMTFLFDLDDTLVASGSASWIACTDLVNDILWRKGVRRHFSSEELTRRGIGIPIDTFLSDQSAQHNFELSDGELAQIHADADIIIRNYFKQHLQPVAAVCESLAQLRRRNHRIGIVTSSSSDWIDVCIEATQIKAFIDPDLIFSARARGVKVKPDPAVYIQALSSLPDRLNAIAVEDSASGITSAKRAGVPVILGCAAFLPADRKAAHVQRLRELGASLVFESWDNFDTVLEQLSFLQERVLSESRL